MEEEATGFAQQANNDDMIYIFQQKNGKCRVVGNEMYQTNTELAKNLGGAATDGNGQGRTNRQRRNVTFHIFLVVEINIYVIF